MARSDRGGPPGPTDPERGLHQGQAVAKVVSSPDGMTILVGKTARDNDVVTFKLATPRDFWLHVAAESGSHVVVLNPDNLDRLPRPTRDLAAGLAAGHSRARGGGRVAVHLARRSEVTKPRGWAPGKVALGRYETVHATPTRAGSSSGAAES